MESKNKKVRCKRCHKILTNITARERGYGEFCWHIYLSEKQKQNSLFPLNKEGGKI